MELFWFNNLKEGFEKILLFFIYMGTIWLKNLFIICKAFGAVAQLVEHLIEDQGVTGSSPVRTTNKVSNVDSAG